jgi:hypothetical protein
MLELDQIMDQINKCLENTYRDKSNNFLYADIFIYIYIYIVEENMCKVSHMNNNLSQNYVIYFGTERVHHLLHRYFGLLASFLSITTNHLHHPPTIHLGYFLMLLSKSNIITQWIYEERILVHGVT